MKLTVLTENVAGSGFLAEHGLSYLIEVGEKTIIFDAGHTDVFLINSNRLSLDVQNQVDTIVLSHGHWDHGDGLRYLNHKTLIAHPEAFIKRYRRNDKSPIGLQLSKTELENKFKLITSEKPYQINDSIVFLGEIPRLNDFESQTTPFEDENGNPDFVPDDSALAITENNALTVVTGCSHSGICNIVDYAQKVTGIKVVNAVIGGFHLKQNNKQTQQTIAFLKEQKVKNIYPSHCTDLKALIAFSKEFDIIQLKTGMNLKF